MEGDPVGESSVFFFGGLRLCSLIMTVMTVKKDERKHNKKQNRYDKLRIFDHLLD